MHIGFQRNLGLPELSTVAHICVWNMQHLSSVSEGGDWYCIPPEVRRPRRLYKGKELLQILKAYKAHRRKSYRQRYEASQEVPENVHAAS